LPQTATIDAIKAYKTELEKDKIIPDKLPNCVRCHLSSVFFKKHAYRERKFLVIVDMLIKSIFCALLRFRCPGCNKTFTYYPDFSIPHKQFTRPTIEGFSKKYVDDDDMTYLKSILCGKDGVPGYQGGEKTLSETTVHRWISTFGSYKKIPQKAQQLILQNNPMTTVHRDILQLLVPNRKYRTEKRGEILVNCRRLFHIGAIFKQSFEISIFTKLAINCSFS
jgi:hypothetical protein